MFYVFLSVFAFLSFILSSKVRVAFNTSRIIILNLILVAYFVCTFFISAYYSYPILMLFEYSMCLILGASVAFLFTKRRVSLLKYITMIVISFSFILNAIFDEVSIRNHLEGQFPLYIFLSNKEFLLNPLDGYYAASYQFDFNNFADFSECVLLDASNVTQYGFLSHYNGPMAILSDLSEVNNVCVTENIEDNKGIILITHQKGLIYMRFS